MNSKEKLAMRINSIVSKFSNIPLLLQVNEFVNRTQNKYTRFIRMSNISSLYMLPFTSDHFPRNSGHVWLRSWRRKRSEKSRLMICPIPLSVCRILAVCIISTSFQARGGAPHRGCRVAQIGRPHLPCAVSITGKVSVSLIRC